MKIKLTCPVCDCSEIEGDICPNCETNLSTFRMLAELPALNRGKLKILLPVAIAMVFFVGMSLGATGNYLLSKQQSVVQTSTPISSPVRTSIQKTIKPCISGFFYTVRRGDSLSLIASRFYGNEKDWELITKVNPQVKERENSLVIGEKLLVPNLEDSCS